MLILISLKIDFEKFLYFKVYIMVENTWGYPTMYSQFRAVSAIPEWGP